MVVVDLESTGLDTARHVPLEVAALNVSTGERLVFVPFVPMHSIAEAEPEALAVNRYFERRLFVEMLDPERTEDAYRALGEMLLGNTFAGANPAYDSAMLLPYLAAVGYSQPWHHRLADISAFAAAALHIPPTELPGLSSVCEKLGVVNSDPHSALGDVLATASCFAEIQHTWPVEVPF